MSRMRARSAARAGVKWLAQQLVVDEMREARCQQRPELPWTADSEPSNRVKLLMRECCAGCPVIDRCAEMGVGALGGMYAGVWLPWKGDKGASGVRTARSVLRARVAMVSA